MKKNRLRLSMTAQIFLALALAIGAGLALQGCPEVANDYIKPVGTVFLNLLKFIVVPLVMLSIIAGILSMKDISKVGKLGIQALVYFTLTTVFAVVIGLSVSTLLRGYFPLIEIPMPENLTEVPEISLMSQLVGFFPSNIVQPFAEGNMMQIIVITLLFGFGIVHIGEKAKAVRDFCISMNEVVQQILAYIMKAAPIGVFCMLTPVVATSGPQVMGSYAALIGTAYFTFFIHAMLVYSLLVLVLARISPLRFFRKLFPAMLFAYSSDSSVATLPYTMRCTEELGVKKDLGNFVLSLGATINMDGVAIYLGVISVFIATCCGMDLTLSQYFAIALSSTIASIGTPGIPGGSLALMAMVFASAGIPIEGVAIAAGVDRIIDMARTTMSITGDASCAVVLQRFSK